MSHILENKADLLKGKLHSALHRKHSGLTCVRKQRNSCYRTKKVGIREIYGCFCLGNGMEIGTRRTGEAEGMCSLHGSGEGTLEHRAMFIKATSCPPFFPI